MLRLNFLKLPDRFNSIRDSLNKNNRFDSVNLYFQDESRFGLKTFVGKCLSLVGLKPVVSYQHKFSNTYLWGSYSPINGDSFVWEINGVDSKIFEAYLAAFSLHNPNEYKIVVIDNAAFHSSKNINVPDNIFLLRIPPYTPELNPCEQIWQYIKYRFRNKYFQNMTELKQWLYQIVNQMDNELIKSIVADYRYKEIFITHFKV
ncbi:IS630 family transposase [Tenacibaculum maritimum]|uniref:Transposase, IS630/ISSod10 family, OrfB n=1 Tax=Tenacibaculum maritimum NCIMB 2154 TaxID=1349785 RepID=A0A2H1EAB4_9FLAO|nr:IS630 family transposase [Tenacibaculum maritimum]SFZ81895.1 Transposase, IS630/ISSod10 family, OrfB [Tenacibaculum maritimum NCIMB 2154]SFZ82156.1 Transposase, IS630/ISSod10 family, OrfB [Tenacibaculum maritimum NCIMB 2154]SFZ82457.1 Transposase, IS630/ISSod10 family, OrfB [Tenacibaculum maritimum NCIMB 2154]SFZ82888.1 Transposase, IS630/ISSod10 family, OrfB [Tenacibaculum maritimum NCIMB 2154]SFZ83661.1 Transposase, IS630/ISSod10 family, OrfB [Tenacibaculum maritimum NCIMB 2154]